MALKLLQVSLCNPSAQEKEIHLFYEVLDKPIARKYLQLLRETLQRKIPLIDQDRFYNFPHCHKDKKWIVENLNRCIQTINSASPGILPEKADLEMPQSRMNDLHLYFERLRGSVLEPSLFYSSAAPEVQQALNDYNLLIHRYEDFSRRERFQRICPHAVCCWESETRERRPLDETDYLEFQMERAFGDLAINYCELGKPILDVYYDQDEVLSDSNIRPLRYYSADLFFDFTPSRPKSWLWKKIRSIQLQHWWRKNRHRVKNSLPRIEAPSHALGHLVIGRLLRNSGDVAGLSVQEIIQLIGQHQTFKKIQIHD